MIRYCANIGNRKVTIGICRSMYAYFYPIFYLYVNVERREVCKNEILRRLHSPKNETR